MRHFSRYIERDDFDIASQKWLIRVRVPRPALLAGTADDPHQRLAQPDAVEEFAHFSRPRARLMAYRRIAELLSKQGALL